ncbi:unnamed protein product [Heligmosomoides polygyrus]|uniref:DUF1758 domain-containing protein n=1 Tax=Heligmosomoides polygyrus TaxID=6339 RepID=A0A183FBH3_HELPZ|nr:unnamed protein product [Heligmosomoides polygyrus]
MGELQETFNSNELRVTLKGNHDSAKLHSLPVFTKDKLTSITKTAELSRTDKYFIKKEKITIAQQGLFSHEVSPDIIIGQDLLNKVIDHETTVIKLPSGLILTPTIFGYTISGASDKTAILTKNSTSECSSLIIATPSLTAKDDYKENIKHLYELESLGINTDSDTDEASIVKFMDSYRKTITIESGRITAGFPFTDEVRNLKDNFNVAIRRLQNLLRTLQGDKEKFNLYNDTLTSYLQDGIIEELRKRTTGSQLSTSHTDMCGHRRNPLSYEWCLLLLPTQEMSSA